MMHGIEPQILGSNATMVQKNPKIYFLDLPWGLGHDGLFPRGIAFP